MNNSYDIIIIGGGIIGVSCAHQLSELGYDDVLLLEKEHVASKATGRSAGHIRTYRSGDWEQSASDFSIDFYEKLSEEHESVNIHQTTDYVISHSDDGLSKLEAFSAKNHKEFEMFSLADLAQHVPALYAQEITGALAYDGGMHLDPYSAAHMMLAQAKDRGVELALETVVGLKAVSNGIVVETEHERRTAPIVVGAAGAWTKPLAKKLGLHVPIKARTSQIAILQPPIPIDFPMFHSPELGLYGRQEQNGDVLIGGGSTTEIPNPDNFSTRAREEFLQHVADSVPQISEALKKADLSNHWAGRCSSTPDRRPLIGETTIQGFYLCAGFNGGGVERAPFAGRLLAELIDGSSPSFNNRLYNPHRFKSDKNFKIRTITMDL